MRRPSTPFEGTITRHTSDSVVLPHVNGRRRTAVDLEKRRVQVGRMALVKHGRNLRDRHGAIADARSRTLDKLKEGKNDQILHSQNVASGFFGSRCLNTLGGTMSEEDPLIRDTSLRKARGSLVPTSPYPLHAARTDETSTTIPSSLLGCHREPH